MKFEVNVAKKHFFAILATILIVAGIYAVYAYNSGGPPSTIGHSAEEVDVTVAGQQYNLQNAIDQGKLGGGFPAPDYDSGWIDSWNFASNIYSVNHNLGAVPQFVAAQAKVKSTCTTGGFTAGDVITITADTGLRYDNGKWNDYALFASSTKVGLYGWQQAGYIAGSNTVVVLDNTCFSVRFMAWKQFGPQAGGGGGSSSNDFTVAGQSQSVTVSKTSPTTVTIATSSTKAAIVDFSDLTGDCRDSILDIYKPGSPDIYVGSVWQRTNNNDVYVLQKGAFAIVPLTNGQFKLQLNTAGDAGSCVFNVIKIGYLN